MRGIPDRVWKTSAGAFFIGVAILLIRYPLESWEWFVREVVGESHIWKELVRDVGIAFIVAAVVSVIYEYSTRTADEHEKTTNLLNRIMSVYVTKEVWNEVSEEVLRRRIIRRNYNIKMRIERDDRLPSNQRVLHMEADYELYSLKAGRLKVEVSHFLDQHMRVKALNYPRFESVRVFKEKPGITPKEPELLRAYTEEGATYPLGDIYHKNTGLLKLEKEHQVDLPPYSENLFVKLVVKRIEIVNTPGLYTLIMPEMVVPKETEGSPNKSEANKPTITVSIEPPPDGIKATVHTWLPSHQFKPDKKEAPEEWTFTGVMLAGQGLYVVFEVP